MDSRLFGSLAVFLLLILIYQAWVQDYQTPAQAVEALASASPEKSLASGKAIPQLQDVPELATDKSLANPSANQHSTPEQIPAESETVTVITDLLKFKIDLNGGSLVLAELLNYPLTLNSKDKVHIFNNAAERYYVAQSGLLASNSPAPNHYAKYTALARRYELGKDQQMLEVPITWNQDGIKVSKIFLFKQDSYVVEIRHEIENQSSHPWVGRQYNQFQCEHNDENTNYMISTYTGGVIYSEEEKYEKIPFDKMAEEKLDRSFNGWAAIIRHYFVSAWIPEKEEKNHYYTKVLSTPEGPRYILGLDSGAQQIIESGKTGTFITRLYVGPKLQDRMQAVAKGLQLTVDYGVLTIISQPLFWILSKINSLIGNWGWSIILLTLLIKIVFYKLSEAQYKSMANMRRVTPKLQAIRERHADDRQRMSKAMMELYQKEKINPVGGCVPTLIQIPVFIALYWVLLESVEMRQAPFMFWIQDLSAKDPYFVLPVLMGITMYIQQKLNPAVLDPIQAKVFMMLPFIFTVFFAFFPSGLVLYWIANNTITIVQQKQINKKIIPADG